MDKQIHGNQQHSGKSTRDTSLFCKRRADTQMNHEAGAEQAGCMDLHGPCRLCHPVTAGFWANVKFLTSSTRLETRESSSSTIYVIFAESVHACACIMTCARTNGAGMGEPHDGSASQIQDPLNGGQLVVLAANDVEALIQPGQAPHQLIPVHARCTSRVASVEEGQAHLLLQQLPRMVPNLHSNC